MSVRAWKRAITFTVIALIIILIVIVSVLRSNIQDLKESIDEVILYENESMIDISEYSNLSEEEITHMLGYLSNAALDSTLEYQSKYPSLYVDNDFIFADTSGQKNCYLTFDDGPDATCTTMILDILKEYNVKATFFVIYKNTAEAKALYKRIVDEGHTIAVHTASHNYSKIYASVDAYLNDFEKISNHIENITGVKPEIFRFPGGSLNTYNAAIYQEIIAEMIRRGYTYYDWNISSGDASSSYVRSDTITDNVLNTGRNINHKIVLMHDGTGHRTTAEALPAIISGLQAQGFNLDRITNEVQPIWFGY